MLKRHFPIALSLLTVVLLLAGVTRLFHSVGHAATNSALSRATSTPPNPKRPSHRSTIGKPLGRDSAFSTYNNPDYSLSFLYPRTFALTEDREVFGDNSSLKSQEQLAIDQPGLLLLASIEIPDDAYPNTTFSSGHLQFAVNPTASEPVCRALAAPDDPDSAEVSDLRDGTSGGSSSPRESIGVEAIHALIFHWRQSGEFANHMDYYSRDYFAYANNSCYEFFLQVADVVPTGIDLDPSIKPADSPKVLRTLEKIVSTFQIRTKQ